LTIEFTRTQEAKFCNLTSTIAVSIQSHITRLEASAFLYEICRRSYFSKDTQHLYFNELN